MNCPIREHTGDGAYVGRCDFAVHDGYCPRHGALEDYPNDDDRDLPINRRRHDPLGTPEQRREIWKGICYVLADRWKPKYAYEAWKFSRMDDPPREWPEGHPLRNP